MEQAGSAKAGDKREAREGDNGNNRIARAGSDGKEKKRELLFPFPSLYSPALSLIINSNIPRK